jgi:hypothetical protein
MGMFQSRLSSSPAESNNVPIMNFHDTPSYDNKRAPLAYIRRHNASETRQHIQINIK